MTRVSRKTRRTFRKKRGGSNNKPEMKWAFNKKCVIRLLSILNDTLLDEEMTNSDKNTYKRIKPFFFEGLDDEISHFNSNLIRLAGKSDGITDSCEFILDLKTGNIKFVPLDTESRNIIIKTPELWSKNKPFPKPPKENMWIEYSDAIISELEKCKEKLI
jgi:hypothetical protein